jgi:hypothetical protein
MKEQIKKLDLKAGLLICAALIAYFLLMRYLDLVQIVELRAFNFVILFFGIILTFRYYKAHFDSEIDYFRGFVLGIFTSLYAVIPFALFVFFYLWKIEPGLVLELKSRSFFMGVEITAEKAAETVLIEGIVSGVLITYVMMQFYKSEIRTTVNNEHY